MEKIRFYTTDSNNYWKQCKYCGAFCQMVIDNKPTNRIMNHHGDCAVLAYEILLHEIVKGVNGASHMENR